MSKELFKNAGIFMRYALPRSRRQNQGLLCHIPSPEYTPYPATVITNCEVALVMATYNNRASSSPASLRFSIIRPP